MIEPRFMRPDLPQPIRGAQQTFFVPGREIAGYPGVEAYPENEYAKLRIGWDAFYKKAQEAADRWLAKIEPRVVKDEKGNPKYAAIESDRPLVSGLLIASKFHEKFGPLFGDRLIIFVPDRHHIFVFPDRQELYSQYILPMLGRFDDAPYSCSRELFLWQKGKDSPEVIGLLGD